MGYLHNNHNNRDEYNSFALICWYRMLFDCDIVLRLCNRVLWELRQPVQSLMKECNEDARISSGYNEKNSQHHMRGITNHTRNNPTHT